MKNVYMTEYKVKGIKTLDETVALSFYKKTITKPIDTQEYNIKGIYGMNGSGKSGIVMSAHILRQLLIMEDYLNNPYVQDYLEEIINKKTRQLSIQIEYLADWGNGPALYLYSIDLKKNISGKYVIGAETLSRKPVPSRQSNFDTVIEVQNGEIIFIKKDNKDSLVELLEKRSTNLLSTSSIAALFWHKVFMAEGLDTNHVYNSSHMGLVGLFLLGNTISVYMDQADDYTDYIYNKAPAYDLEGAGNRYSQLFSLGTNTLNEISCNENIVIKAFYEEFENSIKQLQEFIRIFKPDLVRIDIDKKEDKYHYICNLKMVYEAFSVDAEFESTGIKKLIKLFVCLRAMVRGGIVFIDEFDSNLHDVYLCALLEYLMDYGQGQLCFTTHNVGPMDVLKRHKKSIDFLSIDHKVYPWIKNGNYSPSNLYRSGMIEGSPFNVEAIDFIGIFDSPEEDEV